MKLKGFTEVSKAEPVLRGVKRARLVKFLCHTGARTMYEVGLAVDYKGNTIAFQWGGPCGNVAGHEIKHMKVNRKNYIHVGTVYDAKTCKNINNYAIVLGGQYGI